jgi:hypothetical protein
MATSAPVTPGDTPGTRAKLVLGQPTFKTVNEDIASIVESKPTPKYLLGLMFAASILLVMVGSLVKLVYSGVGVWGLDNLGLGHHQLRVLGRHRPRRHADQRHPLPVPAEVAHQHQPRGRGDDDLRRHLRRHLPGIHVGRVWLIVLDVPDPEPDGMWPNFRSPLLWDVFAVSTYAPSRSCSGTSASWSPTSRPCATAPRPRSAPHLRLLRSAGAARHRHWQHYERRT